MLKRVTQYILSSKKVQTDRALVDEDIEIVNGVIIDRKNPPPKEPYEKKEKYPEKLSSKTAAPIIVEIKSDKHKGESVNIEVEPLKNSLAIPEELPEVMEETIPVIISSKGRTRDIEGFFLTLQSAGRAKTTINGYRTDLRQWTKLVKEKGHRSLYSLKLKDIEEFTSTKDVNTTRRLLSSLRQLSKWYLRDGYPALNIEMQKVMSSKGKKRIPCAKEATEFIEIRDKAKKMIEDGDRDGLWISLMMMCGLRISEIQTVEVSDKFIQVIGKGDKQRRIPAPAYVIEGLKKIPATGKGGYKKSRFQIDRCLRAIGYTHVHSLRHTYATYLLNKGVKIEEIQQLLGHASIATTQIYAQTKLPEGITDVLEK